MAGYRRGTMGVGKRKISKEGWGEGAREGRQRKYNFFHM